MRCAPATGVEQLGITRAYQLLQGLHYALGTSSTIELGSYLTKP